MKTTTLNNINEYLTKNGFTFSESKDMSVREFGKIYFVSQKNGWVVMPSSFQGETLISNVKKHLGKFKDSEFIVEMNMQTMTASIFPSEIIDFVQAYKDSSIESEKSMYGFSFTNVLGKVAVFRGYKNKIDPKIRDFRGFVCIAAYTTNMDFTESLWLVTKNGRRPFKSLHELKSAMQELGVRPRK